MLYVNASAARGQPLDPRDARILDAAAAAAVARFMAVRGIAAPTPLHALPALARDLGLGAVSLKDEGARLGLGSFKALGGSFAVLQLVTEAASRALGRPVPPGALDDPEVRAVAAGMTFACATDGNHGRSVAWGADLAGARCAIFVHAGVSDSRIAAIARHGARIVRVEGTYDDAVEAAARTAEANGWIVASDTSWEGYERIPGLVMQGYTALLRESLAQLPAPVSHVFIQAGVGGIAATVAGHLSLALGAAAPRVVVVEPARAACLLESARADRPHRIPAGEPTVMAMLECFEPSLIAWRVLSRTAFAFMTVEDGDAVSAMRALARPAAGAPSIVAGESGAAGLAGLRVAARDAAMRDGLGLDGSSHVLLINTEGATDPDRYRELLGADGHRALASAG